MKRIISAVLTVTVFLMGIGGASSVAQTDDEKKDPVTAPGLLTKTRPLTLKPGAAMAIDAAGLRNARQVVMGGTFACAITDGGAVLCWGDNSVGQLGIGTQIDSSVPVTVTGLDSGVASIALGDAHACVVTTSGALKCWGRNNAGQLGDGSLVTKIAPVDIPGLSANVKSVVAGDLHTCVLLNDGAVKCWGRNSFGAIGNGSNVQSTLPLDVTGLGIGSGVTQIVAGSNHNCALFSSAVPRCWGSNSLGQIGLGSTVPVTVATPTAMTVIAGPVQGLAAGGGQTCVLIGGGLKCWGFNGSGQLGNGTTDNSVIPVTPPGFGAGVRSVSAGNGHTCVLTLAEKLFCWGLNVFGQLGNGNNISSLLPVESTGVGVRIASLSVRGSGTCGISAVGGVVCWGYNLNGRLGIGVDINATSPVDARITASATLVSTGDFSTCAIQSGAAMCWGNNSNGMLGVGDTYPRKLPASVTVVSGATAIQPASNATCALVAGAVKCWGSNSSGQLGVAAAVTESASAVTPIASGASKLSAGIFHTCAQISSAVKCWGYNTFGQVGVADTSNQFAPVTAMPAGVSDVEAGYFHTCLLMTDATVRCFGWNGYGQLGQDPAAVPTSTVPLVVAGLGGVTKLAPGYLHTCVLAAGGAVRCFGGNTNGQLGNNSATDSIAPVTVNGLTAGIVAVTSGLLHACALTNAGGVKCWGDNTYGQLGAGLTVSRSLIPVDVQGLTSGVVEIDSLSLHTCARLANGGVTCWGFGGQGQLGDGNAWADTGRNVIGFVASKTLLPGVLRLGIEEAEPNNNSAQANPLPNGLVLRARINDTYDVYTFDKAAPGPINIALSGVPADVATRMQLQLYYLNTASGTVVPADTSAPFALSHNGAAGKYFVIVFVGGAAFDPAQTYDINASY